MNLDDVDKAMREELEHGKSHTPYKPRPKVAMQRAIVLFILSGFMFAIGIGMVLGAPAFFITNGVFILCLAIATWFDTV
jgi:hypothetical protein